MAELEIQIDPHLGLTDQALAVFAMLTGHEQCFEIPDSKTEPLVDISAWAWYNGREKGICLIVRDHGLNSRVTDETRVNEKMLIIFGEHRSSDNIFVDCLLTRGIFINPPTPDDLTDEAYERRRMFDYGRVDLVERYIRNLIGEYLNGDLGWHCNKCDLGGKAESGLDRGFCPQCGTKPDLIPASVTLKKLR